MPPWRQPHQRVQRRCDLQRVRTNNRIDANRGDRQDDEADDHAAARDRDGDQPAARRARQPQSRALCEVPTRARGLHRSPAHCLLGIALQVCNPTPCVRHRLTLAYETRSTEARATDHAVSSKRGAGSEGRA